MSARRVARGFTLLELIVVIGIFAIFAAMAYGGLESVLRTRVGIEAGLNRTEDFDRAYLRLRQDFANAVARGVRDSDGNALPGFMFDSYKHRIEFTRGGWQNLLNLPRATLERVSYFLDDGPAEDTARGAPRRLDDKRLIRRSWYVLDRAPRTEPVDIVLLDHVQELNWRFLDDSRTFQDTWGSPDRSSFGNPETTAALPAPMAVEIKLRTRDWGNLRFLFALGAEGSNDVAKLLIAPPPAAGTTGAASGGTSGGKTTGDEDNDGGSGNDGGDKPPPPPPAQ